jgi:hypothetical protein
MKKVKKRTIAIGTAAIAAVLILILAPWLVCLKFEEPKQADELEELFADIPVKNAQFTASGENHSGGGFAETTSDMARILGEMEIQTGEAFEGITSMEFIASGVDRIYLILHKRDYDIASMDSFHIALVWFDDLGEGVVHFFNKSL